MLLWLTITSRVSLKFAKWYRLKFANLRAGYNITLKGYPLLNVGSTNKPTYYPAELVEIMPGQVVKAKLTGKETTEMLGFACRSPYANAFSITTDGRETLGLDDEKLVSVSLIAGD